MSTTTITGTVDKEAKEGMVNVLNELGLSTSSFLNMLAKQIAREGRLPLTLDINPSYSQELVNRVEDLKAGRNIVVHELIED